MNEEWTGKDVNRDEEMEKREAGEKEEVLEIGTESFLAGQEEGQEWEEYGAKVKLSEPDQIYTVTCPVKGMVIPLAKIPDTTFAYGMLGPGVGILPEQDVIVAPFDGEVSAVFDTKHAVGLTGDDGGVEVLIHVGINTVELKGAYMEVLVKAGEKVRAGQALLTFDRKKIQAAGYNTTVAVLVSNVYLFPRIRVLGYGKKKEMEPLLACRK